MPARPLQAVPAWPGCRRELGVPGQSVQVDVKHLKLGVHRFYQVTVIDEATRTAS
jgi:hypothetical protein